MRQQVTVLRAFMRALKQVSPEPVPEGRSSTQGHKSTRGHRALHAWPHGAVFVDVIDGEPGVTQCT